MLKVSNYCLYFENMGVWGLEWGCPLLTGEICAQDVLWHLFSITGANTMFSWDSFAFLFWFPPADPTQPALPQQQTTASIPGPSPARSACRLEKGVHTAVKRWEEKTAEITVPKRRLSEATFVLVLSKEGLEPYPLQFDFHTLKISEQ